MIRTLVRGLLCGIVAALFSCCSDSTREVLLHRMDVIKENGDSVPAGALAELRKMESDVKKCNSDYIYYKYLLLRTRLQDKADMIPSSSATIEDVVSYFEKHGNTIERMESFYYQGSVYRDLKDYPRSVKSFYNVLDIANKNKVEPCMLLQNTYSQLSGLLSGQQIYDEALVMARLGCKMAEETNTLDAIYVMDVATAAYFSGNCVEAKETCFKTLDLIRQDSLRLYPDIVCELLCRFSEWKMGAEVEDCVSILRKYKNAVKAHNYLAAMVRYYEFHSMTDSVLVYNKRMLSESKVFLQKKKAANSLMNDYIHMGVYDSAVVYASLYSDFVDSVFIENRYEQTSRACGEHLYSISMEKELQARKEAEIHEVRLYRIIAMSLLSALLLSVIYRRKKKRFNSILLEKEEDLGVAKDAIKQYDRQLAEAGEVLHEKQKQITDIVRLSLLERASMDSAIVLHKFHDASRGTGTIETSDWEDLYKAVEAMYPGFRESVMSMPRNSESVINTAYLLKIGLSNTQISILTGCSRTTVWNRVKKIEACLGVLLDSKMQ